MGRPLEEILPKDSRAKKSHNEYQTEPKWEQNAQDSSPDGE